MPDDLQADFFVSYAGRDRDWAEWIAWTLEEAGYRVFLPDWDVPPGSSWTSDIGSALDRARAVLLVMSPSYFNSTYASAEYTGALRSSVDRGGLGPGILPVRVAPFNFSEMPLLLRTHVFIDLADLPEDSARVALISGANAMTTG